MTSRARSRMSVARPEPDDVAHPALHVVADPEPERERESDTVAPPAPLMERLLELDRRRRELRSWMDAEDSGVAIDPPALQRLAPVDGADPDLEP